MNFDLDPSKRYDLTVRYPKDGTASVKTVNQVELVATLDTHRVPLLTALQDKGYVQMSGGPRLSWKPVAVTQEMPECVFVFMRLTELAANGEAQQTIDGLRDYMTDDDEVAHRNAWSLASVGPLIAAHALRRFYTEQGALRDDDLFIIETLPGAQQDNENALAMSRAVIQHANAPQGKGTEYATDIVAAHFDVHGPGGMIEFLVELIKFNAFLWQQGAYETDAERTAENGEQS